MTSFYLSAAHKSSGKTCVSIGLAGAMVNKGKSVQTFKRGPDYIDPIWLSAASGVPCYNLDFNTQTLDEIQRLFALKAELSDACFVEGSKGLFDGVDLKGSDSNAALASTLSLPVILVIDCIGITRGIAPLLLGYQAFDQDTHIAGVILNKTGGERHQSKLRQAVEHYTDIPVLGMLGKNARMEIPERHLGLMPANEMETAKEIIDSMTKAVQEGVNLNSIMALKGEKLLSKEIATPLSVSSNRDTVTIAVAKDAAFGFYYPDDLEAFESAGANLVFFDALNDPSLPLCDGLFIGGGFPEMHLQALQGNESMRASIKTAIEDGLPCYAECGGLMYLSQSIEHQGNSAEMVGVIHGAITVTKKPQGRGLVELTTSEDWPWPPMGAKGAILKAHEFHYGALSGLPAHEKYAHQVKRGYGINGAQDGLIIGNCMASFSHLRNTEQTPWVSSFIEFVRSKQP